MWYLKDQKGQGLVEYVLVVLLMGILAIGGIKFLGVKTHNAFSQAGNAVDDQMNYSTNNYDKSQEIREP